MPGSVRSAVLVIFARVVPGAEFGVVAVDLVTGHPAGRDSGIQGGVDHLQRECRLGGELDVVGDAGAGARSGKPVHDFGRYRARSISACPRRPV
jgi:hypothetical protein